MGGVVAGAIFLFTVFLPFSKDEPKTSPPPQSHISYLSNTTISPTPTPTLPKTHIVISGDTLYSIAQKYYGSANYWTTLWNNNDWISDPRIIKSGWELNLGAKPDKEEELSEKLAKIYEQITAPTIAPTVEPAQTAVVGTSTHAQGAPSSFDSVYQKAGSRYGVPWEILYGLHIMETGGRDGAISSGYGTGAQGPLQFMPGTWALYGVDGNADGAVDINNAVDAIWGAANYLSAHGGVEQGLKSYGGDSEAALNHARSRGYNQ